MTIHPSPAPGEAAALIGAYPGWQIELDPCLGEWTGVRKSGDGQHIRVLAARTAAALGDKLAAAEAGDDPA